jgi:hypothetical protein
MNPKIIIFLALLFAANLLISQEKTRDKLVKRDGTIITCTVKEIGDEEIKYAEEGLRDDILVGIDRSKVDKIIFADGREYKIDNSMSVYEDLSTQKKNVIKGNLFLPISGAMEIGYERSLKPGRSIEGEIGIIYGDNNYDEIDASGVFFKFGYKLIRTPDYYMKGMKYAHILKGSYIKPEIALSTFSYDMADYMNGDNSDSVTSFAGLINFGKQVVYNNLFAVDYYIGAGYATGTDDDLEGYYAYLATGDSSFVLTGGIRIGFLF